MAERARCGRGLPRGVAPRDSSANQGVKTRPAGGDTGREGFEVVPRTVPGASKQGARALPCGC